MNYLKCFEGPIAEALGILEEDFNKDYDFIGEHRPYADFCEERIEMVISEIGISKFIETILIL